MRGVLVVEPCSLALMGVMFSCGCACMSVACHRPSTRVSGWVSRVLCSLTMCWLFEVVTEFVAWEGGGVPSPIFS